MTAAVAKLLPIAGFWVLSQTLQLVRQLYGGGHAAGGNRTMAIDFKGSHFEWDVILWGVRRHMTYPNSYRQLEEMMGEQSVEGEDSTLNR